MSLRPVENEKPPSTVWRRLKPGLTQWVVSSAVALAVCAVALFALILAFEMGYGGYLLFLIPVAAWPMFVLVVLLVAIVRAVFDIRGPRR